jgi:hypothetical protein
VNLASGTTLQLLGSETFTATINTNAGTVKYTGTGSYTSLKAGNSYYNLVFNSTGAGSFQSNAALTVNGALTLVAGTYNSNGQTINLYGDFDHQGGTYTPGTSVLNLVGGNQAIKGSSTFYQLNKTVSTAASYFLTFDSGATNNVTNTLTLQGNSALNPLSIRSSSPGSLSSINPSGSRTIAFLDVQDSNNTSGTVINGYTSVDSGNNSNWNFPSAYVQSVAGTYSYSVPAGCNVALVKAWGAGGGGGGGGLSNVSRSGGGGASGGFSQSRFQVTPLANLGVVVGGGGGGGTGAGAGSAGGGGAGGGFSGVFLPGGNTFANALIIAGGGGGGGGGENAGAGAAGGGGAGGGGSGSNGANNAITNTGGTGATGATFGLKGTMAQTSNPTDGAALLGGDGGRMIVTNAGGTAGNPGGGGAGAAGGNGGTPDPGGGGGGGGYYGGGGGNGAKQATALRAAGGGGGSGFVSGVNNTQTSGNNGASPTTAGNAVNTADVDYVTNKSKGGTGGGISTNGTAGGDGIIAISCSLLNCGIYLTAPSCATDGLCIWNAGAGTCDPTF